MNRMETDYARVVLEVDPAKDGSTMRGISFTVADLKHIVKLLKADDELERILCKALKQPEVESDSLQWTRHLLAYIGDPNKAR